MVKPKRMSEIFTSSSSDKLANTATATATPPYSSEGPTLPVIGAPEDKVQVAEKGSEATQPSKKRKMQDQSTNTKPPTQRGPPPRPSHTLHPSLYSPWTLLPPEIRSVMETQARIRVEGKANVVSVVFSKNQNVKGGINKLKILLGAYKDPKTTIEIPEVLKDGDKDGDALIAISAQGEGTGKLVGIVEMVRRIVAPGKGEEGGDGVEKWWMYTVLSSVEVEWPPKGDTKSREAGKEEQQQEEEEEAFESLNASKEKEDKKMRKIPVLTVWLTRKKILVFGREFGEQTVLVKRVEDD